MFLPTDGYRREGNEKNGNENKKNKCSTTIIRCAGASWLSAPSTLLPGILSVTTTVRQKQTLSQDKKNTQQNNHTVYMSSPCIVHQREDYKKPANHKATPPSPTPPPNFARLPATRTAQNIGRGAGAVLTCLNNRADPPSLTRVSQRPAAKTSKIDRCKKKESATAVRRRFPPDQLHALQAPRNSPIVDTYPTTDPPNHPSNHPPTHLRTQRDTPA